MEKRILRSQALIADDGSAALLLELDDGSTVIGLVDLRVINDIRGQLDRCAENIQSPIDSAE